MTRERTSRSTDLMNHTVSDEDGLLTVWFIVSRQIQKHNCHSVDSLIFNLCKRITLPFVKVET